MDTPDSTTKRCSKCGELKPINQFLRDKSRCKACNYEYYLANAEREKQRARKHRQENIDHYKEQARKYRQENAELQKQQHREYYQANAESIVERMREYRKANSERIKEQSRNYYQTNAERIKEQHREYRKANAEGIKEQKREYRQTTAFSAINKASSQRRAARKRALLDNFTAADWQFALDYFGGCCAACGRQQGLWHTLSADHWIPLSKDGPTTPGNIVPLCHGVGGCNNSKIDKMPSEWLIERFGPRKGRVIQRRIEAYLDSRK